MTAEPLIDSGSPAPNPDPSLGDAQPTRGVSDRKRSANRGNSGKSTGPRSSMGKRIASLNSLKTGQYSSQRRLQLMAQLDEDPLERERIRQGLYASYPPGAPVEAMLLDDLTNHWWLRGQLDRLDAAIKLRELEAAEKDDLGREERRENAALDATRAEVEKRGLIRLPDSAGKFEMLLSFLEQLLEKAEGRQLTRRDQYLWQAVYGVSERNWYAEYKFALVEAGETLDAKEWENLTSYLNDELECYRRSQARYRAEHAPQTEVERESRLVKCSGDGLILFKEMEATDRQIERKLQLLLKVRKERFAREKEEGSGESGAGSREDSGPNGADDPDKPDGGHDGGSAEIPPPKPVQRAEEKEGKAKGKWQKANGKSTEAPKGRNNVAQGAGEEEGSRQQAAEPRRGEIT